MRNSAPQEAASGLLSETSPAGLGVTPTVPSESEEGMLAHCNSSALCVPPEDPGEQASRRHNSAAEGYNLVENGGYRTLIGNSHDGKDGHRTTTDGTLQPRGCDQTALQQQSALIVTGRSRADPDGFGGGHQLFAPSGRSGHACLEPWIPLAERKKKMRKFVFYSFSFHRNAGTWLNLHTRPQGKQRLNPIVSHIDRPEMRDIP